MAADGRHVVDHSPDSSDAIGWYVHVPFCSRKCGYCDFYSIPFVRDPAERYIRALQREAALRDPRRPVSTVFVGGGTPSILPDDLLMSLLQLIGGYTGPAREWSVEVNPASGVEAQFESMRRCGVTRLSLGAQSFDAAELAVLDRQHEPRQIGEAVRAARAVGFDNINLDLIYAIPGQTANAWRETLYRALDLEPEHLACYALTYEPDTPLTQQRDAGAIEPMDESLEVELFELTHDVLVDAGFEHYEISNYARPNHRCLANMIYWQNREYLGLGPSAVSYLDGERCRNVDDVPSYVQAMSTRPESAVVEREKLDPLPRACETAIQMLRLIDGIEAALFKLQTGYDARELFADRIRTLGEMGLLIADERGIRLTRSGRLVANRVMAEFLP